MPLRGTSQVACLPGVDELSEARGDTTRMSLSLRPKRGKSDMRRFHVLLLAAVVAACGDAAVEETTLPPATTVALATTVPGAPQRIVSLSATHTEMLWAIGAEDQIVGTDLTSNFPPPAEETAKVDAFNFDVEEVAALDPDLVVLAFDFAGEVAALEAVQIPTLLLPPPATLEESYDQLRELGGAVGRSAEAAALAEQMQAEIDEVVAVTAAGGDPGTVFHEIDNTLFSANSATFIGDLYARFGFENIADEVPDEFGSGFVQLSPEFVLDADPDFIFLGDAAFGETAETVAARPGWDQLTAVEEGRVIELDSDIAGRWGPRTTQLVRQIGQAITEAQAG